MTCARTVVENPFRLSDGLELPVDTCIAVPAMAIQQDPGNFKNPMEFDGFRFARLNASKESISSEQTWNASTVSTTNLA